MATGNKQVDALPPIPDAKNGVMYIAKDDTDYQVQAGVANGVALLNAQAKIDDALIGKGAANGVAPLNASSKLDGTYIDKDLANGVAALGPDRLIARNRLPFIGGDGLTWTVVSTPTAMQKGFGYIVTAAVDLTLPNPNGLGDEFVVYATVPNVRIVTNGNNVRGVPAGDNIIFEQAGVTLRLVASASGQLEVV